MAQSNLEVAISLRDNFTAKANGIIGTLNRMQGAAGRVGRGAGQLAGGFARVATVAAGLAVTGFGFAAKSAISLESAMAGVNKTMDLTPAELKEIELALRKMSTQIPIGVEDLAALVEQAGALGIAKQDVVEFAKVAATIGVTTNVAADQAATALGVMSNLLGLTGKDYERFASTLVDLGNKGASTEAQILAIAERAAGAGATIGLTADAILGFSSAIANIGIEPEAGGSSLQRFFVDTLKFVSQGGDDLKLLAKTAGMTAKEFKGVFGKEPQRALQAFVAGLADLNDEQRIAVLDALKWDDIRIGRMFLGLAESEEQTQNLSKSLQISTDAWRANTAAAEEADKRYATVESKLKLLKAQFMEAVHVIGEGFLPALGRASDKLKAILGDNKSRAELKKFGEDIGRFIDGINWDDVKSGAMAFADVLKQAAGYAKTVLDALNALPSDLKAALAAFVVLDKASGGLLHQGAGNVVGGLAEALSRGLLSRIPIVGEAFATPVRVVNWPVGFGMGGPSGPASSGIGALGKLFLIGEALAFAQIAYDVWMGQTAGHQAQMNQQGSDLDKIIASGDIQKITDALNGTKQNVDSLSGLQQVLYDLNINGVKVHTEDMIRQLEEARDKLLPPWKAPNGISGEVNGAPFQPVENLNNTMTNLESQGLPLQDNQLTSALGGAATRIANAANAIIAANARPPVVRVAVTNRTTVYGPRVTTYYADGARAVGGSW